MYLEMLVQCEDVSRMANNLEIQIPSKCVPTNQCVQWYAKRHHSLNQKILVQQIEKLKIQLLRDEQVMRHMITRLDKYAVEYNYTKRNGGFPKIEKAEA